MISPWILAKQKIRRDLVAVTLPDERQTLMTGLSAVDFVAEIYHQNQDFGKSRFRWFCVDDPDLWPLFYVIQGHLSVLDRALLWHWRQLGSSLQGGVLMLQDQHVDLSLTALGLGLVRQLAHVSPTQDSALYLASENVLDCDRFYDGLSLWAKQFHGEQQKVALLIQKDESEILLHRYATGLGMGFQTVDGHEGQSISEALDGSAQVLAVRVINGFGFSGEKGDCCRFKRFSREEKESVLESMSLFDKEELSWNMNFSLNLGPH